MFYQNHIDELEPAAGSIDQILAIGSAALEIAVDVFGMLFWSGLGLCLARILT